MGSVVLDEMVIPIVSLTLAEGQLVIVSKLSGPRTVDPGPVEVRIHGRDGSLFARGHARLDGSRMRLRRGSNLNLELRVFSTNTPDELDFGTLGRIGGVQ